VVKNREYHIRARRIAVENELRRLGISALYRRPDQDACNGPAFYRPPERPDPRVKPASKAQRSQGRVETQQLSLEFPLSDDELLEEFNRI
jgi:hypothetical protein